MKYVLVVSADTDQEIAVNVNFIISFYQKDSNLVRINLVDNDHIDSEMSFHEFLEKIKSI